MGHGRIILTQEGEEQPKWLVTDDNGRLHGYRRVKEEAEELARNITAH